MFGVVEFFCLFVGGGDIVDGCVELDVEDFVFGIDVGCFCDVFGYWDVLW